MKTLRKQSSSEQSQRRRGWLLAELPLAISLPLLVQGPCSGGNQRGVDDVAKPLQESIVYVSQVPSDAGEFQISDVHGSFLGDNPERDQPVGGNLFRLDPGGTPINLTQQTGAAVRNPELSWDASRVVFSMKVGVQTNWQIWEVHVDGTGLRQVAQTPYNETEPLYLPDGRIVFASDRQGLLDGYENFPTGQLYVMNPDGTGVGLLTTASGGDVTPTVLESGEIAFVRWHAVIQDPCRAQAEPIFFNDLDASRFLLWAMNPDGDSDAHPIWGTHVIEDFRGGVLQSRPLYDGTGRLLTILGTAETYGAGGVAIIDPEDENLPGGNPSPSWITAPGDYTDTEGVPPSGGRYRDPHPLSDGRYLVSFAPGEVINQSFNGDFSNPPEFGLYALSADGNSRTLIYDAPGRWEIEPIVIAARPVPPILPPTLDLTATSGILNTMDVTLRAELDLDVISPDLQAGISTEGAAFVHVYRGVPSQFVYPAFHGYRQVQPGLIGRAPVFEDGSFAVRVPADVPLRWELVDENGNPMVRERFWNAVRPSQVVTCAGCHSPHDGTTGNTTNFALDAPTDLSLFDPTQWIPGSPAEVASRVEWQTDHPRALDEDGFPVRELFAVDGEPLSDRGSAPGEAAFEVGVCLNVDDPRLFGDRASTLTEVAEIDLISPSYLAPQSAAEQQESIALLEAFRDLGVTVRESGTILHQGAPVRSQVCTPPITFTVPVQTQRRLQLTARDSAGVETQLELTLRCESPVPPPLPGREREDPGYGGDAAYDVQGGCDPGDDGGYLFRVEYADLQLLSGTWQGEAGLDIIHPEEESLCEVGYDLRQVAVLSDCPDCDEAYEFVREGVVTFLDEEDSCAEFGPPWLPEAEGSRVAWGWNADEELWERVDGQWQVVGTTSIENGLRSFDRIYE